MMGKSLKTVAPSADDDKEEELELLLSHRRQSGRSGHPPVRARVRLHLVLLVIGLLGSMGCLWPMLYTSDSEKMAQNLGLYRVANSLENILSLLAFPVLMFMVILTIYAAQQLYRLYKEANDPDTYRRHRSS
jgi:TRAP-type C4-dicarboxylate transport system permease small subunit